MLILLFSVFSILLIIAFISVWWASSGPQGAAVS